MTDRRIARFFGPRSLPEGLCAAAVACWMLTLGAVGVRVERDPEQPVSYGYRVMEVR